MGLAEANLIQAFLPRSHSRRGASQASKSLKVYEENARRCLNGLNQLDALKNAAAATMLQKSDSDPTSSKRTWKEGADPNLFLDILHNQHQTIEHMAQLLGHFFSSALLDRRTAALADSVAPQEIQRTLLMSSPFSTGLFDEGQMEKAKEELEAEVVTRSMFRPAFAPYKRQQQHQSSKPREANYRRPNAPNRPRQTASANITTSQSSDGPSKFLPPKRFRQFFPKGNFSRAGCFPGRRSDLPNPCPLGHPTTSKYPSGRKWEPPSGPRGSFGGDFDSYGRTRNHRYTSHPFSFRPLHHGKNNKS